MNQPRPELSCDEVQALLPLVADGNLDHSMDPVLFEHLAHCQECQETLVRHDLIAVALASSRPDRQRSGMRRIIRLPLPLAAAAALVVATGAWMAFQATTVHPSVPVAEVLRVPGPDGHVRYEIRQGGGVQVVDPELLDRAGVAPGVGDLQQVTLKRRQNR